MKKFTINCDFNGQRSPFTVFIGKPQEGHHPLHFQAEWLSSERGGVIPTEIMESISKLQELAKKNNVSLEDLCVYAIGTAEQEKAESNSDIDSDDSSGSENYDFDEAEDVSNNSKA
jgi:hypothetical protein